MRLFTKKLAVPASTETREVDVAQTWEVRWMSRHGEYMGSTRPEMEVFLSEGEAREFADALKNAFALIRHTSGTAVDVERRK